MSGTIFGRNHLNEWELLPEQNLDLVTIPSLRPRDG